MHLLLLLTFSTAAAFFGMAVLFRRLGMPENRFVVVSFVVFGIVLGLASSVLWPQDPAMYLNIPGTAAGDWIYHTAIAWIGNPNSDQAHFTIPWIMRIPQVYAWSSPVVYGLIGLACQYAYLHIIIIHPRQKFPGTNKQAGEFVRQGIHNFSDGGANHDDARPDQP